MTSPGAADSASVSETARSATLDRLLRQLQPVMRGAYTYRLRRFAAKPDRDSMLAADTLTNRSFVSGAPNELRAEHHLTAESRRLTV